MNGDQRSSLSLARWLATILDSAVRLPGTNIRIGLDPIIGLIPGLGDTLTAVAGAWILIVAADLGLPRIVLARMALNVLINSAVGSVPGVGDLFSFWFKSNIRNIELVERHSRLDQSRPVSTAGDWTFVIALLAGIALSLAAVAVLAIWAIAHIWRLVSPS